MPPTRQTLLRLVAENASMHAEPLLAGLLELLSEARGAFAGDVDKFLIMLVVAIRAAGHRDFADTVRRRRTEGGPSVFPSLGVNIQSVADSIGAPKETIRRKVFDLVEMGWIERRGNDLHLTPAAYENLKPLREGIYALAARHYEVVEAMIANPAPPPGG